jgi:3-demethoxyubiquinol 3-hydroxylase
MMKGPDTRKMLRVDQAGEYGAARIYAGQLAVLGNRHPVARDIGHMAAQENGILIISMA